MSSPPSAADQYPRYPQRSSCYSITRKTTHPSPPTTVQTNVERCIYEKVSATCFPQSHHSRCVGPPRLGENRFANEFRRAGVWHLNYCCLLYGNTLPLRIGTAVCEWFCTFSFCSIETLFLACFVTTGCIQEKWAKIKTSKSSSSWSSRVNLERSGGQARPYHATPHHTTVSCQYHTTPHHMIIKIKHEMITCMRYHTISHIRAAKWTISKKICITNGPRTSKLSSSVGRDQGVKRDHRIPHHTTPH